MLPKCFIAALALAILPTNALAESDYLGQTPPELTPEKFAPGLISTDEAFELNSVFSPDGSLFMFTRQIDGIFQMFMMRRTETGWSQPELSSLSAPFPEHRDADMVFTPDGQTLYFISQRPLEGHEAGEYNIWQADWAGSDWGTPRALPRPINAAEHELYPMIVGDGSLYFTATRPGGVGGRDSFRAQYEDGAFAAPVNLGPAINSSFDEGDIYVAPDESYLIHNASGRPDSLGSGDLYISFRQADGSWSQDVHMGPVINSEAIDFCPMVTPDGKYFFFSRGGDIYWVDAKILETFRPG